MDSPYGIGRVATFSVNIRTAILLLLIRHLNKSNILFLFWNNTSSPQSKYDILLSCKLNIHK